MKIVKTHQKYNAAVNTAFAVAQKYPHYFAQKKTV